MDFPCSGCGACCRRIKTIVESLEEYNNDFYSKNEFPYNWDESGRCEMLSEDNKCKVYENRPLICNVKEVSSFYSMSQEKFYLLNASVCNSLMDEDGTPKEFRLNV